MGMTCDAIRQVPPNSPAPDSAWDIVAADRGPGSIACAGVRDNEGSVRARYRAARGQAIGACPRTGPARP
ncbi:hypothetical protein GCM10011583_26170 [Streptomyces camponoticapitis]|uniref:Uncharacterized protein n=1 Tax=Streptomyces camponoticapitis TaxID=1616125 RepID=A0ABQ2E3R8_9ACTN|nr:hypothetical protein GCM10011583_26170 [Streptomyces camponoticapitis]